MGTRLLLQVPCTVARVYDMDSACELFRMLCSGRTLNLISRQILVLNTRICAHHVGVMSGVKFQGSREINHSAKLATASTRRRKPSKIRPKVTSSATLTQPKEVKDISKSQGGSHASKFRNKRNPFDKLKFKRKTTPSVQDDEGKKRLVSTEKVETTRQASRRSKPSIQALEVNTSQQSSKDVNKSQMDTCRPEGLKHQTESPFKLSSNDEAKKEKVQSLQTNEAKERISSSDEHTPQSTAGKAEQRWRYFNASYLGCTPKEVMQRIKELTQAGFSDDFIDLILKRLPPTLKINSKDLFFNINTFIKWKLQWKLILKYNPELLLLDTNHVVKRLNYLSKIGIDVSCIDLRSLPVLMQCDVTLTTEERIFDSKESKVSGVDLCKNLHWATSSLTSLRSQEDVARLSELLKEIGGVSETLLVKYPYMTYKGLNAMLKVLSGKPLYLDNYQIQHLLKLYPPLFTDPSISIKDLQSHLDELCTLASMPTINQLLRKANGCRLLFNPKIDVKGMVVILQEHEFTELQIDKAMHMATHFFTENIPDLRSLLSHFFTLSDATPDKLIKASIETSYFSRASDFVSARIDAAKHHSPALLNVTRIDELLTTKNMAFAKECGISSESLKKKWPNAWFTHRRVTAIPSNQEVVNNNPENITESSSPDLLTSEEVDSDK